MICARSVHLRSTIILKLVCLNFVGAQKILVELILVICVENLFDEKDEVEIFFGSCRKTRK